MPYNHQEIEQKWQSRWDKEGTFQAKDDDPREKSYILIEFPYPSGAGLHIGHPRSYTALDVVARKQRHLGKNVLYPIGWDAFGLPTENYAIKTGRKPQDITKENTNTFRRQLKSLGLSFDWSREVDTTDPEYYKWTQWMFLEFFKAGLAYKDTIAINWCLSCKIGLANEEVVNGACERCGGEVEKRDKEQWMIAITKYAERLLGDLEGVNYLEKIKAQQRNWIGKSEGAEITFKTSTENVAAKNVEAGFSLPPLNIFTTRPDTIAGATFMVISPELAKDWMQAGWEAPEDVQTYVTQSLAKNEIDRTNETKEKTGFDTGLKATNPVTNEAIPIWVADYVLGGYGTGAIMAVPQHDERDRAFAETFGLPIVDAPLIEMDKAIEQSGGTKTTNYKLRDWVFSRQRYWGEPIPLVHCESCSPETGGWVALPQEQLPLTLPEVEQYEPNDNGDSPLADIEDWVNTTCPSCDGPAKRETDTMPNWAGSSWYFLAYIMKGVSANYEFPITNYSKAFSEWMPVNLYNGGMEHTTLHLLYSRFWNKFLFDQGHVPTAEPYARRHSHGLVMAEDGTKMSKSKGNVVNPDEMVRDYGADALRMFILFMGPFEEPVPWNLNGLIGVRRFLDKLDRYVTNWTKQSPPDTSDLAGPIERHLKKISDDIDAFKFNTAVSGFMSLMNEVGDRHMTLDQLKRVLTVLCPFAPHLANECWERIGQDGLLDQVAWPTFDESLLKRDVVEIGVQINGKVRGSIQVAPDADEATAMQAARDQENVAKYLTQEPKKVIYIPGRILNIIV